MNRTMEHFNAKKANRTPQVSGTRVNVEELFKDLNLRPSGGVAKQRVKRTPTHVFRNGKTYKRSKEVRRVPSLPDREGHTKHLPPRGRPYYRSSISGKITWVALFLLGLFCCASCQRAGSLPSAASEATEQRHNLITAAKNHNVSPGKITQGVGPTRVLTGRLQHVRTGWVYITPLCDEREKYNQIDMMA